MNEMNNQAAQTMPALPRPYWKAGEVRDDFGNPYNETDLFTDDDMRAMYRQGYAAALSQTAGAAAPGRYFADGPQGHFFAEDLQLARDLVNLYDKDDDWTITDLCNPTGVAPAASGAHPDALQDGTLSKSTAKRVEALGAASVSERARELLAEAFSAIDPRRGDILSGRIVDPNIRRALRAIEQALTQQRGEPFAWAMTDHQDDGPMTILTTNREDAKFWGEQGIDVEPLYKAPQPSADAVRDAESWQPIESAPRDGTEILGFFQEIGRTVCWFTGDHANSAKGWSIGIDYYGQAPTHWRPLPAPPTQESAMQQGD